MLCKGNGNDWYFIELKFWMVCNIGKIEDQRKIESNGNYDSRRG